MHIRIFGFSAALILLTALGFFLVQVDPYGAPPAAEEEEAAELPPPEEAPPAEEEFAEEIEEEEEEEPTPEDLRLQAEEAQRRVAEHLEAARLAQEEALRAQRRAGILPEEEPAAQAAPPTLEELGQRIEELEARLAELQATQELSDEEVAALEEELDSLEEHGEFLEENRQARIAELDQGIASITQLFETLSTGDGNIDGALASLSRQLEGTSSDAAQYAGEEEARLIGLAHHSVEAAREALVRQDLYAARIALGFALHQARAARQAAELSGPNPLTP